MRAWHAISTKELIQELRTDPEKGLSEEESTDRLVKYGPNAISEEKRRRWPERLLRTIAQPLFLLIIAAAIIYSLLGELRDAVFLAFMVVPLVSIQFFQEGRMQKAVSALKELTAPEAVVIRHGEAHKVPAETVVPGDLLILEAGQLVIADARVMEARELSIDESILTGEVLPIFKSPHDGLAADLPVSQRSNMLYSGTMVVNGNGKAIVVATAMETELGRIASLVRKAEERPTPLQRQINQMTKILGVVGLSITALVIVIGIMNARPLLPQVLIAIGMAMAAIPEELPFVLTVFLGLGVRRMSHRQALIKRMMAVETLGEVTVICSDKTGTMTMGKMAVGKVWTEGNIRPFAEVSADDPVVARLLECGLLASSARFSEDESAEPIGDPTEVALLVGARDKYINWRSVVDKALLVAETPFDSANKYMSKTWRSEGGQLTYMKGAPEVVLELCDRLLSREGLVPLDDQMRKKIMDSNYLLAEGGLRVLALAYREDSAEDGKGGFALVGLAGIEDPLRPEVKAAVAECSEAGIKIAMLTGDQVRTAVSIAQRLGIDSRNQVVTGPEIERMSDETLREVVQTAAIWARVSPEHKLRIVQAFIDNGEIVAVTGDGVNDAPALKKADIGVAMGVRGTDVAREAADMILVDDNFATIVSAIRDGRHIYDNLRKASRYLIGLHVALLGVPLAATFLGYTSPFLPATIILMEIILDPMSSIVFESEPAEQGIMSRPPRPPGELLVDWRLATLVLAQGATILLASLGIYIWALSTGAGADQARALSISTLIVSQLFLAASARFEERSLFGGTVFENRYYLVAIAVVLVVLVGVVYLPFLQSLFHTAPFAGEYWLLIGALSFLATFWVEVFKLFRP